MSLTFPAAHSAKLKSSSVTEDWLIQLYYDNDDDGVEDGFIGLSGSDRVVTSVQYYGIVSDFGSISRSIDISSSQSPIDDITITCINRFKKDTLSAQLFPPRTDTSGTGGVNRYINHSVKIYSCLNDESTLTNCALLWRGKLKKISHDLEMVTLDIEGDQPFRFLTIPNTVSTRHRIHPPIVYGNYTKANSGANIGYDFVDSAVVHPVPLNHVGKDLVHAINHQSEAGDARLHIYEKNCEAFPTCEIDASPYYDDYTATYDGQDMSTCQADLHHGWKQRPLFTDGDNAWGNPQKAYDGSDATSAEESVDVDITGVDQAGNDASDLVLEIPKIVYGRVKIFSLWVRYAFDISRAVYFQTTGTAQGFAKLQDATYSGNIIDIEVLNDTQGTRAAGYTYADDTGAHTYTGALSHTADLIAADYVMPEKIIIRGYVSQTGTGVNGTSRQLTQSDFEVSDVYMIIDVDLNQEGDPENADKTVTQLISLYSGSDGYNADYTDGGGAVAGEIHQVHRDIMNRFGGVDYDNDYMANWSALDTARDGWNVRWWQLEPRELREILDMLQYEGCFIFMFVADSDGSGNAGGRYIWVRDKYGSSAATSLLAEALDDSETGVDVDDGTEFIVGQQIKVDSETMTITSISSDTLTVIRGARGTTAASHSDNAQVYFDDPVATLDNDDYVNLSLSTVDAADIITRSVYNYNRHPAEEKFQQTATYDNTTDRDNYGMGTSHEVQIDLEALVNCGDNTDSIYDTGSTDGDNKPNETIVRYYDRINSQPRILVSLDIINKAYFNLEVGDIIKVNDTSVDPYGNTWTYIYFMIIQENRNIDSLSITAREVYIG